MKCRKCENELFTIEILPSCDDCSENGAYDEDVEEYTFDEKIIEEKELIRDHVYEEGECNLGTAHDMGCWMAVCSKCGTKTNLPTVEC